MDGAVRCSGRDRRGDHTRNPVTLARAVMDKSPHVLLAGKGADHFAREREESSRSVSYFDPDFRRRQLEELKTKKVSALEVEYQIRHGRRGRARSSRACRGRHLDRRHDRQALGPHRRFADHRRGHLRRQHACAVSATGSGEYFIRVGVAHAICARMQLAGESAQAAADAVMAEVGALGGNGGVIVVPHRRHGYSLNTPGMYRGRADNSGRSVALYTEFDER